MLRLLGLLVTMPLLLQSLLTTTRCRAALVVRGQSSSTRHRLSSSASLFDFGVCADVQYVDADDDFNFQKTKMRRYRQSLRILNEAVEHWRTGQESKVKFALLLGDILDGKANQLQSQEACFEQVSAVCKSASSISYYPTLGNHDYYCFSRPDLHARLFQTIPETSPTKLYYDFSPHPAWRIISLDAYDVSLIGASSSTHLDQARTLLAKENPNDLEVSGSWFNNLPRDKFRFVPYNGGLGELQLQWLEQTLADAKSKDQRCIIFAHQPVHAPDKPQSLIWNSEAVVDIMKVSAYSPSLLFYCSSAYTFPPPSFPPLFAPHPSPCQAAGNVRLWIAGHDHDGQYSCVGDTHHLVPPAPIECGPGERAFGTVAVYEDRIELRWVGRQPSRPTIDPWSGTRCMRIR